MVPRWEVWCILLHHTRYANVTFLLLEFVPSTHSVTM